MRSALWMCALGDLSGFPALCELSFSLCDVMMCESLLGAVRHASLASLTFCVAHPAPGCAQMALQLSQVLKRLRRGSVLNFVTNEGWCLIDDALQEAQGRAPLQKFMAALEACGL